MKRFIIILFALLTLISCKKQEEEVTVVFVMRYTNKTPNGRNFHIDSSKTKILFSNFKYVDNDNKEKLVKDVFLFQPVNNNSSFTFNVPKGDLRSFKFSFGLDKSTNNSIPRNFAASSPLSVETGLYWDMMIYRFLVMEASIDNSAGKDQAPNEPFSMHLGTDTLYTEINTTILPKAGNIVYIELDADKLFVLDTDPFQLTNFSNHSESSEIARAIAIKNSFVNGIKTSIAP